MKNPILIEDKKGKVKDAFNYSVTSSLGALLFLDKTLETSQKEFVRDLIMGVFKQTALKFHRILRNLSQQCRQEPLYAHY